LIILTYFLSHQLIFLDSQISLAEKAILPSLVIDGATFSDWVYRASSFLVVSCPYALVISIPLSFFGGIGEASRRRVLVKGGRVAIWSIRS